MTDELYKLFDENKESLLEDFFSFLRFESVSADPECEPHMRACARWLETYLKEAGFQVELWETSANPIVFAEWNGAGPDKETLLIYNHYDVQPADPIELWLSPPFEPNIRDGEVYARGAQDNKGQCFYVIAAVCALLKKHGSLPVNLKLFIEGDEEIGSPQITPVLSEKSDRLKAEHAMVVDVGFHDMKSPSVTLGLRGICSLEVTLTGSEVDMHSGSHGGLAFNPLHALVQILGKMRADDGSILIPGFYDNVEGLSEEEREKVDFSFDPASYQEMFSAEATGGEVNYQPLERAWLRPTLELNGLSGGYSGPGGKTVIPAEAHAKISCRLVPKQEPSHILNCIKSFIEEHTPAGISAEVTLHEGQGYAVRTNPDAAIVDVAAQAISEIVEQPCRFTMEGASIPVSAVFAEATGADLVLLGYALPTDKIHAPNEHFGVDRLRMGFATIGRIIEILGARN